MSNTPPPEEFRNPGSIVAIQWNDKEDPEYFVVSPIKGVPYMVQSDSYQDFVTLEVGEYRGVWEQLEPCNPYAVGNPDFRKYFKKLWPAPKHVAVNAAVLTIVDSNADYVCFDFEEAQELLEELQEVLEKT